MFENIRGKFVLSEAGYIGVSLAVFIVLAAIGAFIASRVMKDDPDTSLNAPAIDVRYLFVFLNAFILMSVMSIELSSLNSLRDYSYEAEQLVKLDTMLANVDVNITHNDVVQITGEYDGETVVTDAVLAPDKQSLVYDESIAHVLR